MSLTVSLHTAGRSSATRIREVDGVATAFEPIYSEKSGGRWLLTADPSGEAFILEDFDHLYPHRITLSADEILSIEEFDGGHRFTLEPQKDFSYLAIRLIPSEDLDAAHRGALMALFSALAERAIVEWSGESIDLTALKLSAEELLQRVLSVPGLSLSWEGPRTPVELELKRISNLMPEAYELFRGGRQIGYIRLRHGWLRAHYPDHTSSEPVYATGTRGDGFFHDDEERARELRISAVEILRADGVENPDPVFEITPYEVEEIDWDSALDSLEMLRRAKERREAESQLPQDVDPPQN